MYGYDMGQNVRVRQNLPSAYRGGGLLHCHANALMKKNAHVFRPHEKMRYRDGDAESFRGQAPSEN